jgi:hypothetical protein
LTYYCRALKEILDLLVQKAQSGLRERRDPVEMLDLMDLKDQRDLLDPRDLLDHLVTPPREYSTEERKIPIVSRTLRRCVYVNVQLTEEGIETIE